MAWNDLVDLFGGQPVYLPERQPPEPPLLVLYNQGVSVAEPLYDKIIPILEFFDIISIFDLVDVGKISILDALEAVTLNFVVEGITITVPILMIVIVIAAYISNKLTKNAYRYTGNSSRPNSVYEIIARQFDTNLVF